MKLIRFGKAGKEKPGIIFDNIRYDVSQHVEDYNEKFFETGGLATLQNLLKDGPGSLSQVDDAERLGPPVARPSKLICIGLNYVDHAAESNMAAPAEPVVFFKSTTAITGPNDPLILPPGSKKTDWEVELAVVVGKRASYIDEATAEQYIAGYLLHNDYSEREYQLERGGQWVKGKSCDSFAPLGPWLATPDEVGNVGSLRLWLSVNGKMMQDGNTSKLIFSVPFLVSYLSRFMTLLPGDIISTGTPAGVGLGQKPEPIYIKAGDVMELGIDGLGSSRQVATELSLT